MDKVQSFNLAAIVAGKKENSTEKTEYVKEGAYLCTVTGVETSESRENYNGSPYIQFNIKTNCGKLGRAKFWAIKDSDKASTKEWKAKQLKEFLINCGVVNFTDDANAIKAAVKAKVNIAFTYEEYIGRVKDTDEPVVRRAIKYRWTSKEGKRIGYKEDYNQPLSREEYNQFQMEKSDWEKNNSSSQSSAEVDDLPF